MLKLGQDVLKTIDIDEFKTISTNVSDYIPATSAEIYFPEQVNIVTIDGAVLINSLNTEIIDGKTVVSFTGSTAWSNNYFSINYQAKDQLYTITVNF